MRNDEVLDRLQSAIGYLPAQKELVARTGINQTTLSNKSKRNSKWQPEEIEKLNKGYGINILKPISQNITNNCIPVAYLPNVYISAGYGIDNYDEHKETMFIDAALMVTDKGNHINPATCEIVRVSGNSMSPEYRHGDRVIIDRADTELSDGHIYAFRFNGDCYVKEINLLGDKIKCISLNKEYDPFYVNRGDDFIVLGRILPRIRL